MSERNLDGEENELKDSEKLRILSPRILKKDNLTPLLREKMDWILRFRNRLGLYVFPFTPFGKKPKVEAWNTREDRIPVDFFDNYGIRCGDRSRDGWHLIVLDFESLEEAIKMLGSDLFEKLLKETLCVRSAHIGLHVYFFCDSIPQKPVRPAVSKEGLALMDLLSVNSAVLGPGSVIDHSKCESGKCPWKGQEVFTAYEQISGHRKIAKIRKKTLVKIFRRIESNGYQLNRDLAAWLEIGKTGGERENSKADGKVLRSNGGRSEKFDKNGDDGKCNQREPGPRLGEEQIERIRSLLRPAYRSGFRQLIWLFFSGWAAKSGVDPVSALRILKGLYDETGDEDSLKMRAGALVYSYKKAGFDLERYSAEIERIAGEKPYGLEREIREEDIKGITGLQEVLKASLGNKEAFDIISGISEVFGASMESIESFSEIFEAIRRAESQEEVMNLIKRLPDGVGIQKLVDLALKEGLIPGRKSKKLDSGKILISALPATQRAYLLWLLLRELELFSFIKVRQANGEWECYVVGRQNMLFDARAIISALAKKLGSYITSREVVNELMEHIASEAKTVHRMQIEPARYLALKSGILDLCELEIVDPGSLDAYFLTRLPLNVDPGFLENLKAGRIEEDHFGNTLFYSAIRRFYDDDNWEKLKLCLGSILAPFSLKLLAIIVGKPDTGKTTLKEALKACLGDKCASQTLEDLEGRFGLSPLFKAIVNVTSEKSDSVVRCVERIKRIVGGDTLSIEEKFKPLREKNPNTLKMFILVNEVPRFAKIDEAFAERIVIVFADNPLAEDEKDPGIIERLRSDADCIADTFRFLLYCAWLLKKVNYRIPRDVEEVREILEEASFPLADWLRDSCIIGEEFSVEREEAYNSYVNWAKSSGKPGRILTRRKFYELMRTRFVEVKRKGEFFFRGVGLKRAERDEAFELNF